METCQCGDCPDPNRIDDGDDDDDDDVENQALDYSLEKYGS